MFIVEPKLKSWIQMLVIIGHVWSIKVASKRAPQPKSQPHGPWLKDCNPDPILSNNGQSQNSRSKFSEIWFQWNLQSKGLILQDLAAVVVLQWYLETPKGMIASLSQAQYTHKEKWPCPKLLVVQRETEMGRHPMSYDQSEPALEPKLAQ